MNLQAMIMAGGEGTRLRPLTCDLPKPLVPLNLEPLMGYTLKLLKRHGIEQVGVTLCYQPNKIRAAFQQGEKYGLHLTYFEETAPRGTAGSIRMAKEVLDSPFLVLSGDGLTDCDLQKALQFHREKKALATLVLKRAENPLPYGVVMTGQDGRINGFLEKPGWSRVYSDRVNTGIYILEKEIFDHIPDIGTPDFGKDVFPALLEKGLPLYGYEMEGYWCDVGNQSAYWSARQALARGEVALPCRTGVSPAARVHPEALLIGENVIGAGTEVGRGAVLKNAVIGENCRVGEGARIEESCLWDRVCVQEKARVEGSVLCGGAVAGVGAHLHSGSALGSGAVAGAYAEVCPGVKVAPHLKVAPRAVAVENVVRSDLSAPLWAEAGALCDSVREECTLCAAFHQLMQGDLYLVGHSGAVDRMTVAAGTLSAFGAQVYTLGEVTAPMMEALIPLMRAKGGVFARGERLMFFCEQGESLSAARRAKMDALLLRQEFSPEMPGRGKIHSLSGGEEMYLASVLPKTAKEPGRISAAVFSDQPLLLRQAEKGLKRMNVQQVRLGGTNDMELTEGEVGFFLPEDGRECSPFLPGFEPEKEKRIMFLLDLCRRKHGKIFDLPQVPRAAGELSPLEKEDGSAECSFQRMLLRDGLCALFFLCEALKKTDLRDLMRFLPDTHLYSRDILCEQRDKGRILRELCERNGGDRTLGEGVRFHSGRGYATVLPDENRDIVHITAESFDSEFARELCDSFFDQASAALRKNSLPSMP